MGKLDKVGEIEDFGNRTVVMDSYYIAQLNVTETGASPVKDDGSGGAPFFQLAALIKGGPYNGAEVETRCYLGFGQRGAMLRFWNSAVKQVTGTAPDEAVYNEIGFVEPDQQPGEDDRAYSDRYCAEFAVAWAEADPAGKHAFMLSFLRLAQWSGKTVVVHLAVEEDETGQYGPRNRYAGFLSLQHPKKGKQYVERVAYPAQEQALAEAQNDA